MNLLIYSLHVYWVPMSLSIFLAVSLKNTKSKSYTAHWAGRESWSRSAEPGGVLHRSVCGPGCDVWAATGSAPVCWWCRWLRRKAALQTARKGWTPRTPQPGAGPAQRCRWPLLFHCHHQAEQLNLLTRRPLAPLLFRVFAKTIEGGGFLTIKSLFN